VGSRGRSSATGDSQVGQDLAGAGRSGAVDVDEDLALAHSEDDGFVWFRARVPLAVDHALGDEDEVARPALDALATAGAELQSEAPLGLEDVGVVARVDMPAGPGAAVGSGPAGPDVVVGEGLATVHPGRLGSRTVKGIRSDQGGSVHGGLPSDRERAAAYVGRPCGTRSVTGKAEAAVGGGAGPAVTPVSPQARWRCNRAHAGHLILMGGCDRCAVGGKLWCEESRAMATWEGGCWWLETTARIGSTTSCR
jgi:hypothetical protein